MVCILVCKKTKASFNIRVQQRELFSLGYRKWGVTYAEYRNE